MDVVDVEGAIEPGEHLESAGTNGFYKTIGELYRSGCSTATAQRF
jgi:hypothetical protein